MSTGHAVIAEETNFAARGGPVRALLFRPDAPGRHPAVVIGMEATGLNRLIHRVGTELAERGYVAFVPDYYRGGGPADPEDLTDIAGIMAHLAELDFVTAARDVHDAIEHVRGLDAVDPARLATWGYCTGATLTLLATCTRRDLSAAVLYYPSQPWFEALDRAHPVHPVDLLWGAACPVQVLYGDRDVVMSADQLADVCDRLERWGIDHEVRVYEGAGHAFMAEAEGFHHAAAAEQATSDAHAFLARHLPPGPAAG
jgi:carboxymethylenebutenolidase